MPQQPVEQLALIGSAQQHRAWSMETITGGGQASTLSALP
jgi:hypothetical protein